MTDLIPLHAILGTVLSGLREHLDEQGLNGADISMDNPSISLVASYVTSDKPFILGVRGHAELGDHYVTGYGYEWYSPNVGLVRTEQYDKNNVLQSYTVLEELK